MMNIDFNPKRTHQRGAAIIMAMLIMALATVIISGLFWRQHVTIRSIENRLALSQTRWIERAAVDWARVIMRSDAALGDVDHLGEVWALPVAETKRMKQ
jgi:general secretion pathway protein K